VAALFADLNKLVPYGRLGKLVATLVAFLASGDIRRAMAERFTGLRRVPRSERVTGHLPWKERRLSNPKRANEIKGTLGLVVASCGDFGLVNGVDWVSSRSG
jgi:hypothetical protein